MWTTVGKHRQAQGQARQAQSRRENRYVIKVMRLNRGGDTFPRIARTKKVPSLLIGLYLIKSIFRLTYECKAGLKWNTGYLL